VTTGLSAGADESVDGSPLSSSAWFGGSTDELCVPPVTADSPGLVADGSEPTVETGPEPEVVEPEELPDEPEPAPAVDAVVVDPDDVVVDPVVESVEELVDPEDEFDDSDELDDEPESSGAANAAPMPPVPTNPTTPSEKARAPTLNACFCESTYSPGAALDP
jgi:hypothetical protein